MKIGTGTKKGRKLSVQFATNKLLSPAQNLVLQAEINDLPEKVNDIEMALSSEESTIFIHVPEGNSIDVDASLVVEPRKSKRRFAKAPIEASPPKPQSSNRAAILPDNSDDSIIVPKRRGRRKAVAPEFPPEGTEALQKLLEGNRRNKKKQKEEKDGRSENQNEPRVPAEQEVVLPDNSDGSIIVPKRKGRRKVVAPEFPPEGIEALKKLLEENRRKKMNQENEKDGCSTGRNEPNVPLEREASPNQPHMEAEEIRNSSEMEQPQNLLLMSLAQPENTDTAVTIPFIPIAPEYSSIPVDPLHETHPSKKSSKIPVATKRSSKMTAGQGKTPVKTKRPKKSLPYTKKRKNSKSPNKPGPKNNDVEMAAQFADGTSAGPVSVIEDDDGTRDDAPAVSQTDDDGSSISQEYVSIVEDQHQSKLLSKPGVTSNTSGLSHIGRNVEHPNEEGEGTLPMDADVGIENDSVFTDIEDSNDGENEPDLDRINEEEVEEDRTENIVATVSNKSLFGAAQRVRSAVTTNQVIDTPGPSRLSRNVAIGKPNVSIQNVFNRLTPKKRQQRGRRLRKTGSKNANDFVYSRAFITKLAKFFTQTAISKESVDVLHAASNRIFNNLMEDVQSFMDEKGEGAFQDWTHVYEFLRRQDIVADYQQYCGLIHRQLDYQKSRLLIPSVVDGVTVPKYDPKIIENIDVTLNETRGRRVQTSLDESEDD